MVAPPMTISTNIPVHYSDSALPTATQRSAKWSDLPDELEELGQCLIDLEGFKFKTWEELNSRIAELQRSISLDDYETTDRDGTMTPEQAAELHRKLEGLVIASRTASSSLAVSRAASPDIYRSLCENASFEDIDATRSSSPEDYGEYQVPGLTTDEEDSGLDSDVADNEFFDVSKSHVRPREHS